MEVVALIMAFVIFIAVLGVVSGVAAVCIYHVVEGIVRDIAKRHKRG